MMVGLDGFQATIRGIAATSSSFVGAYILQNNGPTTALVISMGIAIIPPIIGAIFVPETLGMREIDFNDEKKEEKVQFVKSMTSADNNDNNDEFDESTLGYIMMSLSGACSPKSSNQFHRRLPSIEEEVDDNGKEVNADDKKLSSFDYKNVSESNEKQGPSTGSKMLNDDNITTGYTLV